MCILQENFKSARDQLQITYIEVESGKAYYAAFIDRWDEKYIVIKYLDTSDQSSVIERTIRIEDIVEFKIVRPVNLEESYLKSNPESSPFLSALLFAEENPGDESDTVMEEIFFEVEIDHGYYEEEDEDNGQERVCND